MMTAEWAHSFSVAALGFYSPVSPQKGFVAIVLEGGFAKWKKAEH